MSDALRQQLQVSLGTAYTVERELGGGGMSRVFLARDEVLGRRVVVKVLHPDLAAGLSAARFGREVTLAARLQHPHLVPVHAAGDVDGLPYYTMPFVDGESLRQRLDREGPLPVADAVRLVRELADGLAYAHGQGVVHRDLKPENVLLSGGHAVIADFGIAKALSSATQDGHPTAAGTTGLGVAVGTPAYMAPEQAAADPATDHRADLYALGLIAYEMLAGQHPFGTRAPYAMLAAHLTEPPAPLAERRPGVPPALATLVMRLLAKGPTDRPQDAAEVTRALDGVTATIPGQVAAANAAPAAVVVTRGWRRRPVAVAAAVLLAAIAVIAIAARMHIVRRAPLADLDADLIVVAPFRVSGDASLAYLREGMLDLLAAKLTGEGGPRAGDPRTLLSAWRRAARDGGDLPEPEAVALAGELGAGQLLLGAIVGTPQRISLRASLLAVPSGRVRTTADVEGPVDSLGALVDRLAANLLARSAGEAERLASSIASTPLPVLRLYLDGMANRRRGRYPEAQRSFTRALTMDSAFVHAAVGLVLTNGYHPIDDSAAWAVVEREGHRLNERDRAFVEARRRFLESWSYASQFEALRRLVALAPDRADAWNEYGDAVADFGGLTGAADFQQRARTAYRRALELDPEFVAALGGLIDVSADVGDTAAVRALWPQYERLAGGSLQFETMRWLTASALGDSSTLATMRARMTSLPPRDLLRIAERMMVSGRGLEDAPMMLRALKANAADEYDVSRGALAAYHFHANGGDHELAFTEASTLWPPGVPATLARAHWLVSAALFWDGDSALARAAVPVLEAFARSGKPAGLPHEARVDVASLAAAWHLVQGDTAGALPLVQHAREFHERLPREGRAGRFDMWPRTLDALLELARGDRRGLALARLDSVLTQGFEGMQAGNLIAARLHEARGDPRAALAAVRRRASHGRDGPAFLSTMLREEGRLAALAGDRAGAARAYRHFLALRPDPPPRLRPDVARVRAALARLQGGSGSW